MCLALSLIEYGYSPKVERMFEEAGADGDKMKARVITEHGLGFRIVTKTGELEAGLSPDYLEGLAERPVAGDWVLVKSGGAGGITAITLWLPRYSELRRADTQVGWKSTVVAANFEVVMLMVSMNANYGLNRIERLVATAAASGGRPVVVLSKADLCSDPEKLLEETRSAVPGTDVISISAATGDGLDRLMNYFAPGTTCAVVGSSGVGKSTLLNCLLGQEAAKTASVSRKASRGRHTTTGRSLYPLPGGGVFLDTPGVRAFGLTSGIDGMSSTFPEIEELSSSCRFSDCTHTNEPGCAVLHALLAGKLEKRRYENYMKMAREASLVKSEERNALREMRRKRDKQIAKMRRAIK